MGENASEKPAKQLITRRRFFKVAAKATAAVTALPAITYLANDFTPAPDQPPDNYIEIFKKKKINPAEPIGVLIVSVEPHNEAPWVQPIPAAAWNTYEGVMNEVYGDNWIAIPNATMEHLNDTFAKQFNEYFGNYKNITKVQIIANHHQGFYGNDVLSGDERLAAFLKSIQAKSKRAIIYACGPKPLPYYQSGCDYVALPRTNDQLLGPEISWEYAFKLAPGYLDLIKLVHDNSNYAVVNERLKNRSFIEEARDWATHEIWPRVWFHETPPNAANTTGVVVVPQKQKAFGR